MSGAKYITYEFGVDGRYTVETGIPTFGLAPGEEYYAHRTFNHPGIDVREEMLERVKVLDFLKAVIVYFSLAQICLYHKAYEGTPDIRLLVTNELKNRKFYSLSKQINTRWESYARTLCQMQKLRL